MNKKIVIGVLCLVFVCTFLFFWPIVSIDHSASETHARIVHFFASAVFATIFTLIASIAFMFLEVAFVFLKRMKHM